VHLKKHRILVWDSSVCGNGHKNNEKLKIPLGKQEEQCREDAGQIHN